MDEIVKALEKILKNMSENQEQLNGIIKKLKAEGGAGRLDEAIKQASGKKQ